MLKYEAWVSTSPWMFQYFAEANSWATTLMRHDACHPYDVRYVRGAECISSVHMQLEGNGIDKYDPRKRRHRNGQTINTKVLPYFRILVDAH